MARFNLLTSVILVVQLLGCSEGTKTQNDGVPTPRELDQTEKDLVTLRHFKGHSTKTSYNATSATFTATITMNCTTSLQPADCINPLIAGEQLFLGALAMTLLEQGTYTGTINVTPFSADKVSIKFVGVVPVENLLSGFPTKGDERLEWELEIAPTFLPLKEGDKISRSAGLQVPLFASGNYTDYLAMTATGADGSVVVVDGNQALLPINNPIRSLKNLSSLPNGPATLDMHYRVYQWSKEFYLSSEVHPVLKVELTE